MAAFLGMRGTGDWATNQVPENWAEFILRETPNGSAPMFAMQSMFREETIDSHTHHYWTKTLPTRALTVTAGGAVYIDAGLATPYVYATHQAVQGTAGGVVYVKVSEAYAKEGKIDHVVLMRDASAMTVDVRGRIVDVVYNGSSSYFAVKLTEDDDNHSDSTNFNLVTVDRIIIISVAVPEGSTAPTAVGYDPVEYTTYIQEFRDTLDLTHIALATTLRTGNAYTEAKLDTSELHSINIEQSGFWGQAFSGTGSNGKPLKMTIGMIPFTLANSSSNVVDYATDALGSGKSWLEGGKKFVNTYLAQLFRYAPNEVIAFVGDGALLALNDLAEAYGDITLVPKIKSYGIEVVEWRTPFGTVNLKTHPLFSHETTQTNMMVLCHPKNIRFMPLVGGGYNFKTKFEQDMQIPGQHSKVDGYYTVGAWKFTFPNQFMIMYNLGTDNN